MPANGPRLGAAGAQRRRFTLALAASVALGHHAASAQNAAAANGQRVEAARREGGLMFYTSLAEKDTLRLTEAFEKQTGIPVKVWRSGKNKVLQRIITEARAGRFEADVVLNPSPEMEALHIEKLLKPVNSPVHNNLIAAALPAHREWAGMRVYLFVQAYNTDKVKPEDLPRSYEDLLDRRWKGRLGMEIKQTEWFFALVQHMGEDKGLAFFRALMANEPSLREGMSLLNNMVTSGEVALAINDYSYLADQLKATGAPVAYVNLMPAVAYTDAIGILGKPPHPQSAALFYDFLLTEGQRIVGENKAITTHRRDEARLDALKPIYIDPAKIIADYDRWLKLFQGILNQRAQAR
jgi:iron(III) transport system substrate-binding protein